MSRETDIADAIVTFLNSETYSPSFDAERKPYSELIAGDALEDSMQVEVVPFEIDTKPQNRAKDQDAITLAVVLGTQVDDTTAATLDPLSDLAESIQDALRREPIAGRVPSSTSRIPYSADHLRELSVWISTITLVYSVFP